MQLFGNIRSTLKEVVFFKKAWPGYRMEINNHFENIMYFTSVSSERDSRLLQIGKGACIITKRRRCCGLRIWLGPWCRCICPSLPLLCCTVWRICGCGWAWLFFFYGAILVGVELGCNGEADQDLYCYCCFHCSLLLTLFWRGLGLIFSTRFASVQIVFVRSTAV
jgi:hypothetical protein